MKVVQIFLNRLGGTLKCSVKLAESFPGGIELKAFVSKNADADVLKDNSFYTKVNTGAGKISNVMNTLNPLNYHRILKEIKLFKPDVIHFPIEHAWNFFFLLALENYPIVQTIHDPVRHPGEENFVYDYLRHLSIQRADRIVVLSNQFKESFEKFGINQEQVEVIPHGSFSFDDKISEPPLKKKILFSGRINKYKGLDVLLKAFLIIQTSNSGASLTIAGKGDVEPYKELLVKIKNITLINKYLSEEELEKLHSECDFVVVPYIEASQSGVIALAAANGRAVISSNIGGLTEQVVDGKTGYLVEKGNPEILAEKMSILLNNNDLVLDMGRNARQYYSENYSWEVIAQKNIQAYAISIRAFRNKKHKSRLLILKSALKNLLKEKHG